MEACNQLHTVAIDSTGEVARLSVADRVGLNIEGTASASYSVDIGVETSDGFRWFTDEATYSSTADVSDGWQQAEPLVRIRVTSAATAGSEADILVATS